MKVLILERMVLNVYDVAVRRTYTRVGRGGVRWGTVRRQVGGRR